MSSAASWSEGHDVRGYAVALACAADGCEAVHVSTVAPRLRGDALTASVVAGADAAASGWCRDRCPEHTGAAS